MHGSDLKKKLRFFSRLVVSKLASLIPFYALSFASEES